MPTQLTYARKKKLTPEMRKIAQAEGLPPEFIRKQVASGKVVIPKNLNRRIKKPCGIGEGLRTKVNANIGTSSDRASIAREIRKLEISVAAGADTVMDLSTSGDLTRIRKSILRKSPLPVGTVPIYEAAVTSVRKRKTILKMREDEILAAVLKHAKDGVDFATIHAGVTRESLASLKKKGRLIGLVSRGGAFLAEWMIHNKKENPLYANFAKILKIARQYDLTLSLGDGLRPGAIADAGDEAQHKELEILSRLSRQAQRAGVQAMIEGPGHVPLNRIKDEVRLEKKLSGGAPFYVLGPIVTDVAPGYDHITSAIGGAVAAMWGADFLCYVTPSEHLRLPTLEDVREGVIASRIAAHAADIAKGVKGADEWDRVISRMRRKRDWQGQIECALDPERARKMRKSSRPRVDDVCTMCGRYCAIKLSEVL